MIIFETNRVKRRSVYDDVVNADGEVTGDVSRVEGLRKNRSERDGRTGLSTIRKHAKNTLYCTAGVFQLKL